MAAAAAAMSLMRFRIGSACHSLHLRQLCTSTSKSNNTHHLLISAFNKDTFQQHYFSIPIIHHPLSLGSKPTSLLTLTLPSSHSKGLNTSQYLNPFFLLHRHDSPHSNHAPILTYNPTTQQALTLPHSLTSETETDTTLYAETHFGFDPLTNTHKVLRVEWTVAIPESNHRVSQMVCTVFTLGCRSNGSWRKVKINPELPFHSTKYMSAGKSVCINGAIHWLTQFGNYIVAFDLKDENFRLIPLPHNYKAENFKPLHFEFNRLIELGGCLALVDYKYSGDRYRGDEYICQFWILKDYHNHVWVEEKISVPFDFRGNFHGKPIPIGTIPTGEMLLEPFSWYVSYEDYPACLLFYDIEGQGFKKVDVTGLPKWVYNRCHSIIRTISVYEGASKSIFA